MADTTIQAVTMLARADLVQLRLTGLILSTLIERRLLTGGEAAALVGDAMKWLGPDDREMRQAYSQLQDEVQQ